MLQEAHERAIRRHVLCDGFDVVLGDPIYVRAPNNYPTRRQHEALEAAIGELVGEPVKVGYWTASRSGRAFSHARRRTDPRVSELNLCAPQSPMGPRKSR